MNCNCIEDSKVNFKVSVDQLSEKEIIILDRSDWLVANPKESVFKASLTHPKGVIKDIELNRSTIKNITSSDISETFTDGIYCIKVDSCGIIYTNYFALTFKLYCGLYNIANKDTKIAKEVKDNIDSIHSLVVNNYKDRALELYKITEKILSYYNCSCK